MGTVPLLTPQGEVRIARRIERGERRVLNSLSRSEFALREILALQERIRKGLVSANMFEIQEDKDGEEDTPEKRLGRARRRIGRIERLLQRIETEGKRRGVGARR